MARGVRSFLLLRFSASISSRAAGTTPAVAVAVSYDTTASHRVCVRCPHSMEKLSQEGGTLASFVIQVPANCEADRGHSCSSDELQSQESNTLMTCMRLMISIPTRVFVCAPSMVLQLAASLLSLALNSCFMPMWSVKLQTAPGKCVKALSSNGRHARWGLRRQQTRSGFMCMPGQDADVVSGNSLVAVLPR